MKSSPKPVGPCLVAILIAAMVGSLSALATEACAAEPEAAAARRSAPLAAAPDVAQLIQQAGDADDDGTRLQILRQLQARSDLDKDLRTELDRLESLVDRWVDEPRLFQWFHRQIRDTLDYDFGVSKTSPLFPLTHLYRARMLIWTANEYGNIKGYHDARRRYFDRATAELRAAAESFPAYDDGTGVHVPVCSRSTGLVSAS